MQQVIRNMTLACVVVLMISGPILTMIGWQYDSAAASDVTKIHPSTYLMAITAALSLFSMNRGAWNLLTQPRYLFFAAAATVMLLRAIAIALGGVTNGEFSAVVVTFVAPALLLICLTSLEPSMLAKMEMPLRIFFLVDSLIGIGERLAGRRMIPSFMDALGENRSAALLAHPLQASLLTGMMVVYLVTSRRHESSITRRLPEILIHMAAMFAFGGRASLVFTATCLVLSGFVIDGKRRGQAKASALQKALPWIIIGVGVILMFLPIEFVDKTLDRFTNDNRSSETRDAAIQMLGMLTPNELLFGINGYRRTIIMKFFGSDFGIELAWVALVFSYGLLATIPMFFALPTIMFLNARRLDRSAFFMSILFLASTAGAISFGAKTTLISIAFMMMAILAQPVPMTQRRRSERIAGQGVGLGFDMGERPSEVLEKPAQSS